MIKFGIIHAVHRIRHTLTDCIASLHAAGINQVSIFSDRGEFGALHNMKRALRVLASDRWCTHVCVVDDDLVVCQKAILKMHELLTLYPDDPLTLYTVEQNIPHDLRSENGWIEAPVSVNTWGGMIVMTKDLAHAVATKLERDMDQKRLDKAPDAAMYEALGQLGVKVRHHIPSLTQDIGDGASTLGNEHTPETKGFRYNEWES